MPPPLGQKILNNALVPIQTGKVQGDLMSSPEENEHILQGEDYDLHLENIQKAQENKKRNTFALKVGNTEEQDKRKTGVIKKGSHSQMG